MPINLATIYVVEFSIAQRAFHIETLADAVNNNLKSVVGRCQTDYVIIGAFENYDKAFEFSEVLREKKVNDISIYKNTCGGFSNPVIQNTMDVTNLNRDRKQRRKSAPDLSTMVYGKIPPQAKEIEEAILGAIMVEKEAIETVSLILKPESFYVEGHQRIYRAMCDLQLKGTPIDILTVVEQLRYKEELEMVGGPYYVTKLTNTVVSAANIETHARIVQQKFVAREIIRISGEMIGSAYEDSTDPFDLLEFGEKELGEIGIKNFGTNLLHISAVSVKAVQELEERRKKKSHVTGISSGYPALDNKTLGFQNGEFIIIAGRPGQGKTACALNIAANAATNKEQPTVVAIWSLEMKPTSLVNRMFSSRSGIPLSKIISGRINDEEAKVFYDKGIQVINGGEIYFDDKTGITIQQIKVKARKYKRKHNLGLIIVDYLQLITATDGYNREQQISMISREMKNLSLELDIPIIALSQMSRDFEKRSIKIPQLSDLRESGAIEQDADMVIFIWEPTAEEKEKNNKLIGKTRIRIAKQRNGMEDFFICDFDKTIQLISNMQQENDTSSPLQIGAGWKPVQNADLFIESNSKLKNDDDDNDTEPF